MKLTAVFIIMVQAPPKGVIHLNSDEQHQADILLLHWKSAQLPSSKLQQDIHPMVRGGAPNAEVDRIMASQELESKHLETSMKSKTALQAVEIEWCSKNCKKEVFFRQSSRCKKVNWNNGSLGDILKRPASNATTVNTMCTV